MAIKIHPTAKIHETVVLGPNVTIGANVEIGPYCIIGLPGEHRVEWGTNKGVIIRDNAILTGLVTVDGGIKSETIICSGAFIMKHAHVGHDAVIGKDVTISCGAKIGGYTIIGSNANIGLNAVIHQNHFVRPWCMVGMGAVLPLKVETEDGHTYVGNPARCIGHNKKAPGTLFL